jgi:hypothetical protein
MTKIKAMPRRILISTPFKHILLLIPLFLGHYFYHDLLDPFGLAMFDSPLGVATCCIVSTIMLMLYGLVFYIPIRCVYQIVESAAIREKLLYAACLVSYGMIMLASQDIAILKERIYYGIHREGFAALRSASESSKCYSSEGCLVAASLPASLQDVFGESVMIGSSMGFHMIVSHSRHNVAFVNINDVVLHERYKPNNTYVICFHRLEDDWYLCELASGN